MSKVPGGAQASDRSQVAQSEPDVVSGAASPDRRLWRLQQRYEDYLRSTVDWVWQCDADLTLQFVSAPVALSLGIPAQLLIGRNLGDLGQFDRDQQGAANAESAIKGRRPFRDARYRITSGPVAVVYKLSGVATFEDTTGHFTGYRGTARLDPDVAGQTTTAPEVEHKLVETLETVLARNIELEAELANTERLGRTTDGYLARLAHELRTPLNAIQGYAQLATREPKGKLPEPYANYLQSILTASRHLETLLADLDRSNREAVGAGASATVDIADVIQEAKKLVMIKAGDAGVDLSRVGPVAHWRIKGDHRACLQIIVNLLGNAVKYTPRGGSVGAEAAPVGQDTLEIKVWDTGIGIPEEEQKRVFQSSYRADHGNIDHRSSGRGLGLAIVCDLARAMHGDIRLESMAGAGSCFILRLPLAASDEASQTAN